MPRLAAGAVGGAGSTALCFVPRQRFSPGQHTPYGVSERINLQHEPINACSCELRQHVHEPCAQQVPESIWKTAEHSTERIGSLDSRVRTLADRGQRTLLKDRLHELNKSRGCS